jgi:PD-(D/E)XK nuclease superfamily
MEGKIVNKPPLTQTLATQMSCEHLYKLVQIDGLKTPNTGPSYRGTDIHAVLAPYALHCAQKRVPADFMYLDSLCSSLGDEAAQILESCRDNITIDWQNLFAVEVLCGLDRDFQPTNAIDHGGNPVRINEVWGIEPKIPHAHPAYCGTLDVIYILPGGRVARIVDWKSHPRPFEADTIQGKLYSLLLFMHMPELQEIEFGLRFVRYANKVTTHKYFRSDVPQMMEDVRRIRNRQKEIHLKVEEGGELRVHGGAHCTYCPCALDPIGIPCPNGALNPMLKSPAEMLNWMLSTEVQLRQVKDALKQFVDGTEQSVVSTDANGKHYTYGPVAREKVTYPVFEGSLEEGFNMPIIDALLNWVTTNPKDLIPRKGSKPWFNNLRLGATELNRYLKTDKREIIHSAIRDLAIVETVTQLKATRDAEVDDGQGSEHRSWNAAGDQEIEF